MTGAESSEREEFVVQGPRSRRTSIEPARESERQERDREEARRLRERERERERDLRDREGQERLRNVGA